MGSGAATIVSAGDPVKRMAWLRFTKLWGGASLLGWVVFPGASTFAQLELDAQLGRSQIVSPSKDCPACNLTGAELPGADLSGANLKEAILRQANLQAADLSQAILNLAG